MILVYRYRVKSLNGLLNKQSHAVNYVCRKVAVEGICVA